MPFFSSNKFSPKKTPTRKVNNNRPKKSGDKNDDNLKIENDLIKLNLGGQETIFQDGNWIPENGPTGSKYKDNQRLSRQVQQLEEENNLLKLKIEILLDMLTETTAEAHIQDKEITRLRQDISRS
uniref:Uncharacterized protein n=1 Tax=Clastoptera arizonana TaxID=38151 RepID=A0A1B6EE88_9HEMI